mmetsp:Transcript_26813/g.48373  ORF Transcript_26813/g.48373 Transcript_26813/m.48373 type:complete len:206 (+) Transcript_26813:66-683(+)
MECSFKVHLPNGYWWEVEDDCHGHHGRRHRHDFHLHLDCLHICHRRIRHRDPTRVHLCWHHPNASLLLHHHHHSLPLRDAMVGHISILLLLLMDLLHHPLNPFPEAETVPDCPCPPSASAPPSSCVPSVPSPLLYVDVPLLCVDVPLRPCVQLQPFRRQCAPPRPVGPPPPCVFGHGQTCPARPRPQPACPLPRRIARGPPFVRT